MKDDKKENDKTKPRKRGVVTSVMVAPDFDFDAPDAEEKFNAAMAEWDKAIEEGKVRDVTGMRL